MGNVTINVEKEYQVHWRTKGLSVVRVEYFETLEEAQREYENKKVYSHIDIVELLECKPIKMYQSTTNNI